jgi:hypothetical protein
VNAAGGGEWSDATRSQTAAAAPAAPAAPTVVVATADTVSLRWEAPANTFGAAVAGYTLEAAAGDPFNKKLPLKYDTHLVFQLGGWELRLLPASAPSGISPAVGPTEQLHSSSGRGAATGASHQHLVGLTEQPHSSPSGTRRCTRVRRRSSSGARWRAGGGTPSACAAATAWARAPPGNYILLYIVCSVITMRRTSLCYFSLTLTTYVSSWPACPPPPPPPPRHPPRRARPPSPPCRCASEGDDAVMGAADGAEGAALGGAMML